jgi:hypothetical protein
MRRALSVRRLRIAVAAAGITGLLAGCGPSVDRAFSKCSETAYKQALSGSKGQLPKEMAALFEKAARAQAEQQCAVIREECRKDPQSDLCQRLVQQYGK